MSFENPILRNMNTILNRPRKLTTEHDKTESVDT